VSVLLVCLAGGLGAVARFVLDGLIRARIGASYPVATTVVNLTGSLLLGVVTGLALGQLVSDSLHLVLGVGFLGGYTTFSTASYDTVRLVQERRWTSALANGVGTLLVSVLLAALGLWLGRQV